MFEALRKLTFSGLLLLLAPTLQAVEVGQQAPDFTLPGIQGNETIQLSELRGKVVYLDFWASWCAPCLISLPLYNDLYQRYQSAGLEIVGVNVDDPVENGQEFLLDTPLDFRIPADPEGNVPELYNVLGMPTSVLIDRDGVVRMVHVGFRQGDLEKIEVEIKALLEE